MKFLGTSDNDTITGTDGHDTIFGFAGDDILFGDPSGAHTNDDGGVTGPKGLARDNIHGGTGDDEIHGGALGDRLWGGAGHDTFVYGDLSDSFAPSGGNHTNTDVIHDFNARADLIDIHALDIYGELRGWNLPHWIGFTHFTGDTGEVRAWWHGDNTLVALDLNGDRHADFEIKLLGHKHIGAHDFGF